ncbi:MAG: DEAD/DEAH box helicase family protein [Symploca sp. SIO2D2]|nr:DEAD/DEAH box helicase family protein [Symploca sp. SIO2D2]
MQLREYQYRVIRQVYKKLAIANRVVGVAPTGSGKTVIAAFIAKDAVREGQRVLFVVHRDRLIPQTQKAMKRLGIRTGVVAGRYQEDRSAKVQIASFQTMAGDRDLSWLKSDVVIADECHITNFVEVMEQRFPKLPSNGTRLLNRRRDEGILIGLTATPWRLSKSQCLGDFYAQAVFAPMPAELIASGFLTPLSYYHVPDSKGKLMEAKINYLVEQWCKIAQNRLTVAFCPTIDFSNALAREFNNIGVAAQSVHSRMSNRKCDEIYESFEEKEFRVLCSVGKLTEGFDVPDVSCGILARDTDSKALFYQMLGRLARIAKGKTDSIVLDAMGLTQCDRFGRFEDLVINESSLYESDKKKPGVAPKKLCEHCDNEILASYKVCPICRNRLDIVGKVKYLPEGQMIRHFSSDEEKSQYAAYQRLLKRAYQLGKPPSWATQRFLKKFSRNPPLDWRRNSVLAGASPEEQEKYKQYLQRLAIAEGRQGSWVYEQLSLELGV